MKQVSQLSQEQEEELIRLFQSDLSEQELEKAIAALTWAAQAYAALAEWVSAFGGTVPPEANTMDRVN